MFHNLHFIRYGYLWRNIEFREFRLERRNVEFREFQLERERERKYYRVKSDRKKLLKKNSDDVENCESSKVDVSNY